ncbi:MAG: Sua5/YciO/YrdC/YwlC family protein, partial [Bacteroidota bacterium]
TASIVLLDLKEEAVTVHSIAPQLKQIGLMLPYTPLYELLLRQFGKAIVATSGNISNTPIIFEDEKAKKELSRIADFILTNNRKIVVPQDDSVIKFSPFTRQKIVLRRSRGLAPSYINAHLKVADVSILAMGAMLKSTFSLQHQNNIYISQYLGDLQQFDTQQSYQHTLNHFLNLFDARVEKILCDKNKDYSSSRRGEELAEKMNIPIHAIQHHIAHFGAILGEHHLVHSDAPILGVIWDGTGLGDDSQIWGGEFFKYEKYDFLRCAHFDYFDFILGDKMPKEPRISALSACWQITDTEGFLKPKFTSTEWQIYSRLLNKKSNLKTSSVGRIFDAVASLLGVLDQQTYEGEAALQLEALATNYFKKNGLDFSANYFTEATPLHRIPTPSLMAGVIMDLQKGESVDFIAAKFHFSLMKLIDMVANNLKIKKIAFSGGVFQNGLLVDLIRHHLHSRFELYFHEQLSPNDENISFGQLICYEIEDQKYHLQIKKKYHVSSDSR